MRSCEATEALFVLRKMSASAIVAPAAVTSTLTSGPSRIRQQRVGGLRSGFWPGAGHGSVLSLPCMYEPSWSSSRRSARPAASVPRPSPSMPSAMPAESAYDSRHSSSSLVGGRPISPRSTSVISRWAEPW